MSASISKTQFISDLKDEQARWEALLDDIGEAHMTQPDVAGGWSIKDIVAHLTGWRRRSVARFQSILRHESSFAPPWPPELETDGEINAWIYAANRDRSLADVLQDSRDAFQQLVDTLQAFPETELLNPKRFGLEEGEIPTGAAFFAHFHEEHEPDMRAWLSKIRQAGS